MASTPTPDPTPRPMVRSLRSVVDEAMNGHGAKLNELTVLAPQRDPYRQDTPAGHRDGRWLAEILGRLGDGRLIHLRGLHYATLGLEAIKPNGSPYVNTEEDWLYLSEQAAKSARWLGYVPFERIIDQRNAAPIVRLYKPKDLMPQLSVGLDIEIPDVSDLEPRVLITGFEGVQPYRLVIIGEKSSLDGVLAPVADQRQADLYLPTGEISDTLVFKIAEDAHIAGRPLVVFYFSDCDPAGWQMPISVERKLQACRDGFFPQIDFKVHRVALTPDQVRAYGLPSAPMKSGERRRDAWFEAMGVEQSEIDALATLQPALLQQIALDAIAPYWDATLVRRVTAARRDWLARAQAVVDAGLDAEALAAIRADAGRKLAEMQDEIDRINGAMQFDIGDFELPEPVVPTAVIDEEAHPLPLFSTQESWADQTRRLMRAKRYQT